MIHYIRYRNYLSVKEEIELSFEATKDLFLDDSYVREVAGLRLLRFGVIYGANASGKTNILSAFNFLKDFVLKKQDDKANETNAIPFLLSDITPNEPSSFEISFVANEKRYVYKLVVDQKRVYKENLSVYQTKRPTILFERIDNDGVSQIDFNPKKLNLSQVAQDEIAIKCLSNMSLFAAYSQVNIKIEEFEEVLEWVREGHRNEIGIKTDLLGYAERKLYDDESLKQEVIEELRNADFNIVGINTEVQEQEVPDSFVDKIIGMIGNMPESERERLRKENTIKVQKTEFEHLVIEQGEEKHFSLPLNLQSEGTKRMLGLTTVIKLITKDNTFITIDELESSMHPKLMEFVIEQFLKADSNSQMLVTTHCDGLLEEDDLIRKDAVWFTNKRQDGSTNLYPLTDFKGVNRISSLRKAYRAGNFEAIPNI